MMTQRVITTETISLPDAPDIPGLTFRCFQGETDYPKIAALFKASKDVDRREQIPSLEEIANTYAHFEGGDPRQGVLFAEVDGETIGYSYTKWWQEADGTRIYSTGGVMLPEWRRKGIGRALLHWSEQHLDTIAAGHPQDGPRFFRAFFSETEQGREPLLRSEGYLPTTYFAEMLRPDLENLPEAPMPDGLEIRPVLPEHYQAIWEADNEAGRDHWGYTPATEQDYQAWLNDPVVFQPELWCIAWDGDQVAGQVRSFINHQENADYGRKWGYTEFISVRRPWRRRGLARALLVQSLHTLKQHAMDAANLGVHVENPNNALHLYESVGFQTLKMYLVMQKPLK